MRRSRPSMAPEVLLFGDADQVGTMPAGVEVIHAPISIAKAADPVAAVRSTPDASIVQAARAVGEGRADAFVAGGSTGSALAAGTFHIKRAHGIYRPALALPIPVPGRPITLLDVGANLECSPRAPRPVRVHGRRADPDGARDRAAEGRAAQQRRGAHQGDAGRRRGLRAPGRARGRLDARRLHRQHRGRPHHRRHGRRDRRRRLHRQHRPEAGRGHVEVDARAGAQRDHVVAARGGRRADAAPGAAAAASPTSTRGRGRRVHAGAAQARRRRPRALHRYGWSQAILLAVRGTANDVVGRTHAALEEAGALRRPAPVMSEEATTVPGQR